MTMSIEPSSRTILCPTDFSPASLKALRHAAGNCTSKDELIVLHIDESGTEDRGMLIREHLHNFSACSDMLSAYGCQVRFAVEYGSPATSIIAYARRCGAGMIVLGSHGTSDIRRLLVGSTAEAVMRNAPCPVLVLRSPENSDEGEYLLSKAVNL